MPQRVSPVSQGRIGFPVAGRLPDYQRGSHRILPWKPAHDKQMYSDSMGRIAEDKRNVERLPVLLDVMDFL